MHDLDELHEVLVDVAIDALLLQPFADLELESVFADAVLALHQQVQLAHDVTVLLQYGDDVLADGFKLIGPESEAKFDALDDVVSELSMFLKVELHALHVVEQAKIAPKDLHRNLGAGDFRFLPVESDMDGAAEQVGMKTRAKHEPVAPDGRQGVAHFVKHGLGLGNELITLR